MLRLPAPIRSLLTLLRRPRVQVEHIGRARLIINSTAPPIQIREYTACCLALLREALRGEDSAVDVLFDQVPPHADPARRSLRIGLQIEHTLVKPGGRDSVGACEGTVPLPDGSGRYLVRIAEFARLDACDIVIDYSRPNIEHLRRSGRVDDYLRRVVHVAPLLYDLAPKQPARSRAAITLFADTTQPRRDRFLRAARAAGLPLHNVRRTFDAARLRALYRDTRVLVNVHQTDHHDTLEELRILPALLCGVVVVSEDVPLRETVPYACFIVWAPYGRLVETVRDVLERYEHHRRAIFDGPELQEIVAQMQRDNVVGIASALRAAIDAATRDASSDAAVSVTSGLAACADAEGGAAVGARRTDSRLVD